MDKKAGSAKIFKTISNVVIWLLCGIILIFIVMRFMGKPVFIFGRTSVWVMTPSMEDKIPAQSYIRIEKVDKTEVKAGDVITFYSDDPRLEGALNTHRVVEIINGGEEFVTKGDSNPVNDVYHADGDKIIGRYVRNQPLLTMFGRIMNKPAGIFIVIAVLAIISFITFIPDLLKAGSAKSGAETGKSEEKSDKISVNDKTDFNTEKISESEKTDIETEKNSASEKTDAETEKNSVNDNTDEK